MARVDRAWGLATQNVKLAARLRRRHAADRRRQRAGQPLRRRSSRCLTGCREPLAVGEQGEGHARPLRADRAARPRHADAGRSRGLQRRPQRRPPGPGHRRRTRPTAATPSGPSTATRAAATATAARRTPRRTPATPGGKSIWARSCRSTRSSIYNRTDGDLGKRLDGFTLKVLDGSRGEVFKQEKIPAPEVERRVRAGRRRPGGASCAGRR